MANFFIKPKAFYDSFQDVQPSQPCNFTYGERPTFTFSFLPNEIQTGDLLVFAVDNDMVFYDATPENILHSTTCMVVVKHTVTSEEATAGKVEMCIETRTVKFRDVTNGKVRPVDVVSGLYRLRGIDASANYVLMAKARAFANGIIADYDSLPEPITTDDYYDKDEIDGMMAQKADESDLTAHTSDTDVHVTVSDKTAWDSKADISDIPTNVSELTNDSDYQTGTDVQTAIVDKADKATTLAGYGITDAYTKSEVDGKVSAVYRAKGSKQTYAELPVTGNEVGDVWNIETADSTHGIDAGDNVVWTSSDTWDVLGGTVDLSNYIVRPAGGSNGDVLTKTANGEEWTPVEQPQFTKNYFAVKTLTAQSTVQFKYMLSTDIDLEYSLNNGATWTALHFDHTNPTDSPVLTPGRNKTVLWRGDNSVMGGTLGYSTSGSDITFYSQCRFVFTGQVELSGKLISLLDKSCVSDTTSNYFRSLFDTLDEETDYNQAQIDATKLIFPNINGTENGFWNLFHNAHGLTQLPPNIFKDDVNCAAVYRRTFANTGISGKVVLPAPNYVAPYCYQETFANCTGITEAEIMGASPNRNAYCQTFNNCSNLHRITVHFTSWKDASNRDVWEWSQGAPATGVWRCPKALGTTVTGINGVPTGWTVEYIDENNVSATTDVSDSTYTINAGMIVPVITVASALTLSAGTVATGNVGYAEVVIDLESNATVTAGTNITFVDAPATGKRNVCVVRWQDGVAKLYVTLTEDLETSSSSSN